MLKTGAMKSSERDNRSTRSGSSSSGVYTEPSTSSPNGRDSRSESWGSKRSASGESRGSLEHSFRSTTPMDQSVAKLLNQMPEYVRRFSWELKREFAKLLNPLKEPSGNDYRKVASRLGFTASDIKTLETKDNPTMELLEWCTNTTTEGIIQVIMEIGRHDVIYDLLDSLRVQGEGAYSMPTQESLDDSASSGWSGPLDDSFNSSIGSGSDRSRLSKTPSENKEDEKFDDLERFITEESREFWYSVPGDYYSKRWKHFFGAMEKTCPEEVQKSNVAKFICHVLKLNYDERDAQEVGVQAFCRLVAWFGPMQPGKEGCLYKIRELITKSVSKDMNGRQSWFAGHMNETDSETRLRDLAPGHFLVRFSSSRADEGYFVLAVKTQNDGVVQIQIEATPREGILLLGGQHFTSLVDIIAKLRNDVLLQNCRQLLINPCPNLPLNAMFSGYCHGRPRRRMAPKGRGRPK